MKYAPATFARLFARTKGLCSRAAAQDCGSPSGLGRTGDGCRQADLGKGCTAALQADSSGGSSIAFEWACRRWSWPVGTIPSTLTTQLRSTLRLLFFQTYLHSHAQDSSTAALSANDIAAARDSQSRGLAFMPKQDRSRRSMVAPFAVAFTKDPVKYLARSRPGHLFIGDEVDGFRHLVSGNSFSTKFFDFRL